MKFKILVVVTLLVAALLILPFFVAAGTPQYEQDKESCAALGRHYYTLADMRHKYSELEMFNSALRSTDAGDPEATIALLVMIHTVYKFPAITPATFQKIVVEKCLKNYGYTEAKI